MKNYQKLEFIEMSKYRKSKLIERYDDVVFELDTALISNIANNAHQKKAGHRFIVDNSGESTPFDWYYARFNVDINLELMSLLMIIMGESIQHILLLRN